MTADQDVKELKKVENVPCPDAVKFKLESPIVTAATPSKKMVFKTRDALRMIGSIAQRKP